MRIYFLLFFLVSLILPPNNLGAENNARTYSFKELLNKGRHSVVSIRSKQVARTGNSPLKDYFRLGQYLKPEIKEGSLGTGFIVSSSGLVLTNYHVITPPPTYSEVGEITVHLSDQKSFSAKVIGKDKKLDVALLQIQDGGTFSPAKLGDSGETEIGAWVMAIGNPFGLEASITVGIVSGMGRVLGAGPYDQFIQTDAIIHAGNTGGPLYNIRGEVIGINTTVATSGHGIGFAVPINVVKRIIPMLQTQGEITRGWLGVMVQSLTLDLVKAFKLQNQQGALIADVMQGSPAEDAGLLRGDVILKFNGHRVKQMHDLPTLVAETPVGKRVLIQLIRDGKARQLNATIRLLEED